MGGRSCTVTLASTSRRQSNGSLMTPPSTRLEPQDAGAEDAAVGEHLLHPRLDGAEVLADDERAGAMGLEHQDAEHRVVVEADERAGVRREVLRHPPQAEQAEHVVDAEAAGMGEHRAQHVAVRHEGRLGEGVRAPRRLAPVLPHLVVHVRRGADADAGSEHVLQRPGVRALGVDPDGEVVHDADRHAGRASRALRHGHLLVDEPLHPHVEVDEGGVLLAERRDGGDRPGARDRRATRPSPRGRR